MSYSLAKRALLYLVSDFLNGFAKNSIVSSNRSATRLNRPGCDTSTQSN